ncbi:hypothetical protein ACIBCT_23695 [Streptosporangium sp. NPDC050855]|uniref:hypothetical protein n=1 Tax=Streptosporangium sp. NPDC050855 TaxID=3366194 RepID=UPI0037959F0A
MVWVLLLMLGAIVLGAIAIVVKALKWLLIIAAVMFVAGLVAGWAQRRTRGDGGGLA